MCVIVAIGEEDAYEGNDAIEGEGGVIAAIRDIIETTMAEDEGVAEIE